MNLRKLSLVLMLIGTVMTVLSLVWFLLAYAEAMDFIGQYGGADISSKLVACLYSSPPICEGAGFLSDAPSYSPAVFWIGVVALLAGMIIHFSLIKNVATKASTDSITTNGNILGFIPEHKYTRTTYIMMLTGAVGGLLVSPLMVVGFVGFILGLLGLFAFKPRLSDLDYNHLAALCIVFTAAFMLLLLVTGSFVFLLVGLIQIALFYIGFNSYQQGRIISIGNLRGEARLALQSISERFSRHE